MALHRRQRTQQILRGIRATEFFGVVKPGNTSSVQATAATFTTQCSYIRGLIVLVRWYSGFIKGWSWLQENRTIEQDPNRVWSGLSVQGQQLPTGALAGVQERIRIADFHPNLQPRDQPYPEN